MSPRGLQPIPWLKTRLFAACRRQNARFFGQTAGDEALHQMAAAINQSFFERRASAIAAAQSTLSACSEESRRRSIKQRIATLELRRRKEEVTCTVPFAHEVPSDVWRLALGPQAIVAACNAYRIVDDVLDAESLASLRWNLDVRYATHEPRIFCRSTPGASSATKEAVVRRGNLVTPWDALHKPRLIRCRLTDHVNTHGVPLKALADARRFALLLLDADYAEVAKRRRIVFVNWVQADLRVSAADGEVKFSDESTLNELRSFVAPHAMRGTDYHRFIYLLVDYDASAAANCAFKALLDAHCTDLSAECPMHALKGRVLDLRAFLREGAQCFSLAVGGCLFFRSTWSVHVSEYLRENWGVEDDVFGVPTGLFRAPDRQIHKYA